MKISPSLSASGSRAERSESVPHRYGSSLLPEPIKTSVNDLPGYVAITNHGKSDKQVAQRVKQAFDAADIPSQLEGIKENSVGVWYNDVVHVVVGRKKPG